MAEPIVIVHGWSDESKSFSYLASFLKKQFQTEPVIIRLSDWISMNNDVTYSDISTAMQRAWAASGLPTSARSVNVIVHSTGALIVRDWMTKFYTPENVPIKRLVMLAPANFGSPLAHKGRSFIGRAIKGWGQPDFQTGTLILKGLELGSPYTYNLAELDLFNEHARWYGRGRILCSIFVGNSGYSGVAAIANEDGSDGTVRISTANLNAAKLQIKLNENQEQISVKLTQINGAIAFKILDGLNHSTIVLNKSSTISNKEFMIKALTVTDDGFSEVGTEFPWQVELNQNYPNISNENDSFQNTVTYLHDDSGEDVTDYFVEFYRTGKSDKQFEKQLYERFISTVHPYEDNPAYRALYLDMNEFDKIKSDFNIENIFVSITAHPLYKPPKFPVGYVSLAANETGGLQVPTNSLADYFKPHRTLLVDIEIYRVVSNDVFKLREF